MMMKKLLRRSLLLALTLVTTAQAEMDLLDTLDKELSEASEMMASGNWESNVLLRGRLLEETYSYSFEAPTAKPTASPTAAPSPSSSLAPTASTVPTPAPTKATIQFFVSLTFYLDGLNDTDTAVEVAELICLDEAAEAVMLNYTKDTFEPDAGPLGDELEAACVILNSTDTEGGSDAAPVVFDCEISMHREDAQEPTANVFRTSAQASALLEDTIAAAVNGTDEPFVDDLLTALAQNTDSDCTDNLALSLADLVAVTAARRRLLQTGTILDNVGNSFVSDTFTVSSSTSSPTLAPTEVPTFLPTVTVAPTFAPTGQACQYDSDCPTGQECVTASRRRQLLFGYSAGSCKPTA